MTLLLFSTDPYGSLCSTGLNWSMCHGPEVTGGTSCRTTNTSGLAESTPMYFLSDQKCPKGTSCWTGSTQVHFLLNRKYLKVLPIWSASDCPSQICPKVSHSRPKNGLDWYAAQADTTGHRMVQTTTNNAQITTLRCQHAASQNQRFYQNNRTMVTKVQYN